MKLLPRSLFGRITLVLVGGFLAVQLLTTAIHISDREALVYRIGTGQAATRIADAVRAIEATAPADRSRIMQALSDDRLQLRPADRPGGAGAAIGDEELARAARDALTQALDPGVAFTLLDARLVRPETDSWVEREFSQRPGVHLEVAVGLRDGSAVTAASLAPPRQSQWVWRLLRNLAIVDGVMILLCFFAVRLVTRPLSTLARAAEELGRNIERPPLPETGAVELARAARALNTMQDRLRRYVDTRLKVLGAMSHDLKTPLTRMRLRVEMLDDAEARVRFTRDLESMQQMVDSTLDYMRGLSDGGEAVGSIDLNALIANLGEDARDAGHAVSISGMLLHPVPGRPQALRRCLQNLLDNALIYGRRADVWLRDEGGSVSIAIADQGPGIPEAELEKVFDPFYRVEASRNRNTGGSGLGLAIARNIAQAHGGSLSLRNRAQGGLEALLVLPRVA